MEETILKIIKRRENREKTIQVNKIENKKTQKQQQKLSKNKIKTKRKKTNK